MEESHEPTQVTLSDQAGTARVSALEQREPSPKKDYQPPQLELLGNIRTVTGS